MWWEVKDGIEARYLLFLDEVKRIASSNGLSLEEAMKSLPAVPDLKELYEWRGLQKFLEIWESKK